MIKKAIGTKNPADMLTTYMSVDLLLRHMGVLGTKLRGDRAETAPQLNSVESKVASWTEPLRFEYGAKMAHFAPTVKVRPIPSANALCKMQREEQNVAGPESEDGSRKRGCNSREY